MKLFLHKLSIGNANLKNDLSNEVIKADDTHDKIIFDSFIKLLEQGVLAFEIYVIFPYSPEGLTLAPPVQGYVVLSYDTEGQECCVVHNQFFHRDANWVALTDALFEEYTMVTKVVCFDFERELFDKIGYDKMSERNGRPLLGATR